MQRRLLQSLLLAAHGLPGDAGNWAGRLLESTAAQLRQAGASEAAARAALQRADGLHLVVSLLERLRGAVRGAMPSTQAALFQQVGMAAGNIAVFLLECSVPLFAYCSAIRVNHHRVFHSALPAVHVGGPRPCHAL